MSRRRLAPAIGLAALALGVALPASPALAEGPASARLISAPCRVAMAHDTRRCFQVEVAEDPAHPQGRHIFLDGFVVPAAKPGPEKHAIFMFGGGPGERETDDVYAPAQLHTALPEFDVVMIDQRGSGETPDIRCGPGHDEASIKAALIDEWPIDRIRACVAALKNKADLTQYTTLNSAIDYDLERQALGYDRIDLVGGSYGTRMAQAYIHLYPERVRSAVLLSPVAPDQRMPEGFARHTEMSLQRVLDLCMEDTACRKAFPDAEGDLGKVKAILAKGPISAAYNGKRVTLSPGVVGGVIRGALYDPNAAAGVPLALHALANGDNDAFAAHAVDFRIGTDTALSQGLYLSIVCGEDFAYNDVGALHREDAGTLYGSFRTDQLAAACAVWPNGHDAPELHILKRWDGPVLTFVGDLDPVTPGVYAQRLMTQFPNGRLIRLPNQGHGTTEAAFAKCMLPMMLQFLKTPDASKLDPRCAETLTFPAFKLQ
ncbi:MAG TPA: alpha/beta fold hydrolase [Caulobacteraceae bacterium]|jgi:pimeloyl-ACP methyl ester carboxylesterase|nr:alpha/beta fold hydrolase [Caulobacteraceae bacterium]